MRGSAWRLCAFAREAFSPKSDVSRVPMTRMGHVKHVGCSPFALSVLGLCAYG